MISLTVIGQVKEPGPRPVNREAEAYNRLAYLRGRAAGLRLDSHGIDAGHSRWMTMTIFAHSGFEFWLGLPDEGDRLRRAVAFCQRCTVAALANPEVQALVRDHDCWSEETVAKAPTVITRFEETSIIGPLNDAINLALTKNWGPFESVSPVDVDTPIGAIRSLIVYHENNRYNRRFKQRMAMRQELPPGHRKLVNKAFRSTKTQWLKDVTEEQVRIIRSKLRLEPDEFWRATKATIPFVPAQQSLFDSLKENP